MTEFKELVDQAKAISCRDVARSLLGPPDKPGSRYDQYKFFKLYGGNIEHTPSLTVWDIGFKCYSAQWADDANGHGDGIKLWMVFKQLTGTEGFRQAVHEMTNTEQPIPQAKPGTLRPEAPKKLLTLSEVQLYQDERELAVSYFHDRRALSVGIIDQLKMGAAPERRAWYKFLDGTSIEFQYIGYSIPNIALGEVRSINFRRDDDQCRRVLLGNQARLDKIASDLKLRDGSDFTVDQIMNRIFMRYQCDGQKSAVYNKDLLITKLDDGTLFRPQLPYVGVIEGEIDAATGRDHGYIVITYPQVELLAELLGMYPQLYWLADNDPEGQGLAKARNAQARTGRGRIVMFPREAKDMNGLAKTNSVVPFMTAQGIPQMPLLTGGFYGH